MTNLLIMLSFAAAIQDPGGVAAARGIMPDRANGPTAVTDLFIIPPKIPDCRTREEVEAALKAKRDGQFEKCDVERFLKAHGR